MFIVMLCGGYLRDMIDTVVIVFKDIPLKGIYQEFKPASYISFSPIWLLPRRITRIKVHQVCKLELAR